MSLQKRSIGLQRREQKKQKKKHSKHARASRHAKRSKPTIPASARYVLYRGLPGAADGVNPGDVYVVLVNQPSSGDSGKGPSERVARKVQLSTLAVPVKFLDFLVHGLPHQVHGVVEPLSPPTKEKIGQSSTNHAFSLIHVPGQESSGKYSEENDEQNVHNILRCPSRRVSRSCSCCLCGEVVPTTKKKSDLVDIKLGRLAHPVYGSPFPVEFPGVRDAPGDATKVGQPVNGLVGAAEHNQEDVVVGRDKALGVLDEVSHRSQDGAPFSRPALGNNVAVLSQTRGTSAP